MREFLPLVAESRGGNPSTTKNQERREVDQCPTNKTEAKARLSRTGGLHSRLLLCHGYHSRITEKAHCREECQSRFRVGVAEEAAREGGIGRQEELGGRSLGLGTDVHSGTGPSPCSQQFAKS